MSFIIPMLMKGGKFLGGVLLDPHTQCEELVSYPYFVNPPAGSKWIWDNKNAGISGSASAHCKIQTEIILASATNVKIITGVDNYANIYIDGTFILHHTGFDSLGTYTALLPAGTHRLLADCYNTGQQAGFCMRIEESNTGNLILGTDDSRSYTTNPGL